MRILHVCSDFGIPVFGHKGASVHLRAMSHALRDLGHDVTIVSPATEHCGNPDFDVPVESLFPEAGHAGVLRELCAMDRTFDKLDSGHPPRLGYEVRSLLYSRTVAQAAARFVGSDVDLVYERYALFANGGLQLARSLGVPHVLEVNAPLVLEQGRARGIQLRELALQIEKQVWRGSDAVLVVSNALREEALSRGVAPERICVVPNGVDPRRFDVAAPVRARVRAERDVQGREVVGFVGSFKPWHGTDVLIRAFARLRQARPRAILWLVGDGPMRTALEAEAARNHVRDAVRFTGGVDHARVPELIAAMDVAVAPYQRSEMFYFSPLKVYEYMACGVPVVASSLGEVRSLERAGLVVGVEPGSEEALMTALHHTLDDSESAARRAGRARRWVRRARTWKANARRVADLGIRNAQGA